MAEAAVREPPPFAGRKEDRRWENCQRRREDRRLSQRVLEEEAEEEVALDLRLLQGRERKDVALNRKEVTPTMIFDFGFQQQQKAASILRPT